MVEYEALGCTVLRVESAGIALGMPADPECSALVGALVSNATATFDDVTGREQHPGESKTQSADKVRVHLTAGNLHGCRPAETLTRYESAKMSYRARSAPAAMNRVGSK